MEAEIVRLGLAYQLASSHTSFVAVLPLDATRVPIYVGPVTTDEEEHVKRGAAKYTAAMPAVLRKSAAPAKRSKGIGLFKASHAAAAAPMASRAMAVYDEMDAMNNMDDDVDACCSLQAGPPMMAREGCAYDECKEEEEQASPVYCESAALDDDASASAKSIKTTPSDEASVADNKPSHTKVASLPLVGANHIACHTLMPVLTQEAQLTTLAALQKFDGSFTLSFELCSLAGADRDALVHLVHELGVTEGCVATAVALAFFDLRLGSLRQDWQLLAAKVRDVAVDNEQIITCRRHPSGWPSRSSALRRRSCRRKSPRFCDMFCFFCPKTPKNRSLFIVYAWPIPCGHRRHCRGARWSGPPSP